MLFNQTGNKERICVLSTSIPHYTAAPGHCNMATKWNKGIQIRNKEVKPFLFIDNMVMNTDNSKEFTEKSTMTNKWV